MKTSPVLPSIVAQILCGVCLVSWSVRPARAVTLEWTRQFGTSDGDYGESLSVDGFGNVYVAGATPASLGGPNAGGYDAYISKIDALGTVQWTNQFGTPARDWARGVSADGPGNVYITGYSEGSLAGPSAGGSDAFLSKYDAAGNLLWARQFGTSEYDYGNAVSVDGLGNVYVAGTTPQDIGGAGVGGSDVFISKFDALGTVQWTKQFGTLFNENVFGVSADGLGNVFLSGETQGSLTGSNAGGVDAFVVKYDAAGNLDWTKQLGTSSLDVAGGVAADGLGNVFITGPTQGSLGGPTAGGEDAFLNKYDAAGNLLWTKQFGTSGHENGRSVFADGLGRVYVVGTTFGDLGAMNAGMRDAYVARYDLNGSLQSIQQLGTSADDWGVSISADGLGNVYISGNTGGDLGGPNAGGFYDVFVAKYHDAVPEPSSLALCSLALLSLTWRRCRR